MTPQEVAEAIANGLARNDVEAIRAVTTEAGWVPVGGSVRAMAESARRKPMPPVKPFGQVIDGGRAVAGLALEVQGNVIGKIWVLCEPVGDGWKAAGMAQVAAQAGLYLDGTLPAVWDWRSQGRSEVAESWGDGFIAALAASMRPEGPKSLLRPIGPLIAKGVDGGKVLGSHDLAPLERAVVMLSLEAGGESRKLIAVVDTSGDEARPITLAPKPDARAFFAGLDWERDIPGEPEVARRRR